MPADASSSSSSDRARSGQCATCAEKYFSPPSTLQFVLLLQSSDQPGPYYRRCMLHISALDFSSVAPSPPAEWVRKKRPSKALPYCRLSLCHQRDLQVAAEAYQKASFAPSGDGPEAAPSGDSHDVNALEVATSGDTTEFTPSSSALEVIPSGSAPEATPSGDRPEWAFGEGVAGLVDVGRAMSTEPVESSLYLTFINQLPLPSKNDETFMEPRKWCSCPLPKDFPQHWFTDKLDFIQQPSSLCRFTGYPFSPRCCSQSALSSISSRQIQPQHNSVPSATYTTGCFALGTMLEDDKEAEPMELDEETHITPSNGLSIFALCPI
ncbi:hypothetical protein FDECE_11886 [Fusarium decemcellulare]|nr:hypothetical protein FDECE_11886 [Fusarium decemcellulare]